jgi:hypothetical protein
MSFPLDGVAGVLHGSCARRISTGRISTVASSAGGAWRDVAGP